MFDIGGLELLLIAVVGLLVIGPERLPEALRTLGLWLGRLRRSFMSVKTEIEKEIGMDEIRRQLHNEAVMDEMKRIEREVQAAKNNTIIDPNAIKPTTNVSAQDAYLDLTSGPAGEPAPAPPSEPAPEPNELAEPAEPAEIETHTNVEAAPEQPPEPEPTPIPPTDADLEAAWERKQRTQERK